MDQNSLFASGLGLASPWKVISSGLEPDETGNLSLCLKIEVGPDSKLPCPHCGKLCLLRDHEVKRWRHLSFWQHPTYLVAKVPWVECPEHGVGLVPVPWSPDGSGFKLMP
jgi:hypothetical protein